MTYLTFRRFMRRAGYLLGVLVFIAAIDIAVLDRWQIGGRVVESTGQPVKNAQLIIRFFGEQPLVNLPIPPHPNSRTAVCMGSREVTTNENGKFAVDLLTSNRRLANKLAYIQVISDGQIRAHRDARIHSSLVAWSPSTTIILEGSGVARVYKTNFLASSLSEKLAPLEHTYSQEVSALVEIISQHPCGDGEIFDAARQAMARVLSVAQTFTERFKVRSACRGVEDWLAGRGENNEAGSMAGNSYDQWPYDCDALDFQREPSLATLEVEQFLHQSQEERRRVDQRG